MNQYTAEYIMQMNQVSEDYRAFLNASKTERECAKEVIRRAKAAGYVPLDSLEHLKPGDKVYASCMKKTVVLFEIGSEPLQKGLRILGAHIDSPRLDLKQNPLYEEKGLAYFDTHYYGGVKKYQWVTVPLAIHGVIAKKDGTCIDVVLGEDEDEPTFCISDLLIHLSSAQLEKKGATVVEGEKLDVLIGSIPLSEECDDEEEKTVKANILKILKDRYDVEEDDFISAELEVVPSGKARNMGLDNSMILAYGQDDRVCAYTSLAAFLETPAGAYTNCCILVDKEEIGSVGATGMQSRFFENVVSKVLWKKEGYQEIAFRDCLSNSCMLSSDVSAAFDPLYASVFESKNAAYFGKGMVFNKYTGARGKSGSNDANAEYIAAVRHCMDEASVDFQTAELGKVDAGGGGTIAYILALYGMQVIDCGVAVLSMHAPWEIVSKKDVYETKKGYQAFLTGMKPDQIYC